MQTMIVLLLLVLTYFVPSKSYPETVFSDDFETNVATIEGWGTIGSRVSLQTSNCHSGTKCVKVAYSPGGTTADYLIGKNIAASNLSDIYVQFKFRTDAYAEQGSKFLKLYNKEDGYTGYARSTFAIQYASGNLYEVSYGDGSGTTNDTQATVRYDGTHPLDPDANVVASTSAFDPSDHNWHTFEARAKYSSDGQRDGLYQVWIDGVLRLHVDNIKNRNDLNSNLYESVELANYNNGTTTSWNLYYDDVVISSSYIGTDSVAPTTTSNKSGRLIRTEANAATLRTHTLTCSDNETCVSTLYCLASTKGGTCTPNLTYTAPFRAGINLPWFSYCYASSDGTNTEAAKCSHGVYKTRR